MKNLKGAEKGRKAYMMFKNQKRKRGLWLMSGLLFVLWGGLARAEKMGTGTFAAPDPCQSGTFSFKTTSEGTSCNDSTSEGIGENDCVGGTLAETCSGVTRFSVAHKKGFFYNVVEADATRFGKKVDTFHFMQGFENKFGISTANSSAGCSSEEPEKCCVTSGTETISWILIKGKHPHPNGTFPQDATSPNTHVAGVFTYNPGATPYKLSGNQRFSLTDLTSESRTVSATYRARGRSSGGGPEHTCTDSMWKADFSVADDNTAGNRPFGNRVALQFGKNIRVMRTISNLDPIVAVGLPGVSAINDATMATKSSFVFDGLYTNFGGNRSDYQTQKTVFLLPKADSGGKIFDINEVSNLNAPRGNHSKIGELDCSTLNKPGDGFCSGTLKREGVAGEGKATCLVAYNLGGGCQNTLFCVAQEPTSNNRNLKTLTTIIASTPQKAYVTVTPAEPKWLANDSTDPAEVCATLTNHNSFPVSSLTPAEELTDGWTTPSFNGAGGGNFASATANTCGEKLAPFESCQFCTTNSLAANSIKAHAIYVEVPISCSGDPEEKETIAMAGKGVASIEIGEKAKVGGKPPIVIKFANNTQSALAESVVNTFASCSTTSGQTSCSLAGTGASVPAASPSREVAFIDEDAETFCFDNSDNNTDGNTDCADPDCDGLIASSTNSAIFCNHATETDCSDGFDNDRDGNIDCADPDCYGSCPEQLCADNSDNNSDTFTDCADTDCDGVFGVTASGDAGKCEFGTELSCRDGRDNDRDTDTDCDDDNCVSDNSCWDVSVQGPTNETLTCDCANLSCDVTVSGTTASIQWQLSTGGGIWTPLVHTGPTLNVGNNACDVSVQTGDQFRCIASADGCSVDGWVQKAYLKASNNDSGDYFGASVAISGDTVVVSALGEDSNQTTITNGTTASSDNSFSGSGAAYVYKRTGSNWAQEAYLKAPNNGGSNTNFGNSVSISGDTIAVANWTEWNSVTTITNGTHTAENVSPDSFFGAVYVFKRNASGWTNEAYLKAPNAGKDDMFGHSVSISGDTIVVGAAEEDSNQTTITNGTTDSSNNSASGSGAAYVFKRTGSIWAQEAYLKASNNGASDKFGTSVSISGDTIVVGAAEEDSNQTTITNSTTASSDNSASGSGAAYVFKRTGSNWAQEAYLKAPNNGASDKFGTSVSISSDTIVVGAQWESSDQTTITNGTTASGNNSKPASGAAYVFKRTGSNWVQQAYLKADNSEGDAWFGGSVSIFGDIIVVGAAGEYGSSGAAYVFRRTGSNWAQEAYVKAANNESNDLFGSSVSISEDCIVVGAPDEDSNQSTVTNGTTASSDNTNTESGAAYIYCREYCPSAVSLPATVTVGTCSEDNCFDKISNDGDTDIDCSDIDCSGTCSDECCNSTDFGSSECNRGSSVEPKKCCNPEGCECGLYITDLEYGSDCTEFN